jgi:hypothetical protein
MISFALADTIALVVLTQLNSNAIAIIPSLFLLLDDIVLVTVVEEEVVFVDDVSLDSNLGSE